MRLALLKGNRFNSWHLKPYARLDGGPEVVLFRADSVIQRKMDERQDAGTAFAIEQIYYDTQKGNPLARAANVLLERYRGRDPRILPFADRLAGFDVVQTWELGTDWTAEALEAKQRYGVPVAVMVWDNLPFNAERGPDDRARKQRAIAEADVFIVHTERSRRMLCIEGAAPERVVTIAPGVDTDVFHPGPGDRDGFGIGGDEFVILYAGFLVARKGIDFLVLALHELLNDPELKDIRFRLLMVGSGSGRPGIERLAARLGIQDACTFAGAAPYDRMADAFRTADVFALPSIAMPHWQEQFGMSLLEAMASGVASVATRSGAIPEIAGESALLAQPNDFLDLYQAIKSLALDSERRKRLGESGRARALANYTLDAHAKALSDVYARLTT